MKRFHLCLSKAFGMWLFCSCPNKASAETLKPHGVAAHEPHKAFSSCAFSKCCYKQQTELSGNPCFSSQCLCSQLQLLWVSVEWVEFPFPKWDRSVIFTKPVPFVMWAGDGAVVPANLIQAVVVLKFSHSLFNHLLMVFCFLCLFQVALSSFLYLKHESENWIFCNVFRIF